MTLPVYFDIDGTLTDAPEKQWGKVVQQRLDIVRGLIESGREVVIWSGGGTEYARAFAMKYGLSGAVCIGKPAVMVDDNPDIRPRERMMLMSPPDYFTAAILEKS